MIKTASNCANKHRNCTGRAYKSRTSCAGFVLLSASILSPPPANAEPIRSTVITIVDGDGFMLSNGLEIRLCGIDAPEMTDQAGVDAKRHMETLVLGKPVSCAVIGTGTVCDGRSKRVHLQRVIAQCFVGEQDVAEVMVEAGHARDDARYSGGHYR